MLAALLGAAALVQAADGSSDLWRYVSFFTIESNILACVVLLTAATFDPRGQAFGWVRGAATLYMIITGLIYAVLLSGHDVGLLSAWVNDVVHRILPAFMLIDWVLARPWPRARPTIALTWLIGPLAFLAYSLLRGPLVDWYPYPFLDPRRAGGYPRVAFTSAVLAVLMTMLALAVGWIATRRRARTARTIATSPTSRRPSSATSSPLISEQGGER